MSSPRAHALRAVAVGDIVHGISSDGASLICLALSVSEAAIVCRTVTTHYHLVFDRQTGMGSFGTAPASIDSVQPLPAETHDIMLGLDRKFAPPYSDDDDCRLTKAEKDGLVFAAEFYANNPLPDFEGGERMDDSHLAMLRHASQSAHRQPVVHVILNHFLIRPDDDDPPPPTTD